MTSLRTDFDPASRIAQLQPSATFAMIARVRSLQREGKEVLDLTAGEPDFTPPPPAEEAGIRAVREGRGKYTPASGMLDLRQAVADQARDDWGLEYSPEQVVVTSGAKLAISQALLALVDRGQKVLIPTPCWTSYPEMVGLAEGTPVLVACDGDFLPRLDALDAAYDEDCVALLLNTPCNPTGAVYPEGLLREIGAWAAERGIWVISDEIYAALTYGEAVHVSPLAACPELMERGIWVNGMSKAYAMTGWRIGFLAAPLPVAKAIGSLQSQLASCPNAISQIASVAAIREGGEACAAMLATFARRAELVGSGLRAIPGLVCPQPRGAFYAFPQLGEHLGKTDPTTGRTVDSGDTFAEILLEADQVASIGGAAFGDPTAFRISFATSEDILERALGKIAARVAGLR